MNLVDETVEEVLCKPFYRSFGEEWLKRGGYPWVVKVSYFGWSDKIEETELCFRTEEEALKVKPGFEFFH